MIHSAKKAFTLTELLVVVVVVGVLSAVVLPKFSKVLETRKTTEAESLMSSVRTEQEARCALDKVYLSQMTQLKNVVPNDDTRNFSYSLTSTGMQAQSKGSYAYTLKMPSYADGRLCCENTAECAKLNKDYPLCSDLVARADYKSGGECAAEVVAPPQTCSGDSTRSCGCLGKGSQTRSCNTSTGTWTGWGACSVADACDCQAVSGANPGPEVETCNSCGQRRRTYSCRTSDGTWQPNAWSTCNKTASECSGGGGGDICNVDFSNAGYMNRWDYCCGSKPSSNSSCYRTCTETNNTWNPGSGGGSYQWASSSTSCSSGGGGGFANAISCAGYTCSASTKGQTCCSGGRLQTCVQSGGSGGGTTTTVTTYYCAKYAVCSTSCTGYKKGSTTTSGGSGSGESGGGGSGGGGFGGPGGGGGSGGGTTPPGITPPGGGGGSGGGFPGITPPGGGGGSGGGLPGITPPPGGGGGGFGGPGGGRF